MTKKRIVILVVCLLVAALATAAAVVLIVRRAEQNKKPLYFENNRVTVAVGDTVALQPVYPKKSKTPIWTSRNEAVATVDEDGNVTAHAVGRAVIRLSVTVGHETQTALCQVTVAEKGMEAVGQMTVSQTALSVFAGETYFLRAWLQVGTQRFDEMEWTSDNTDVCTVSGGSVTGVSQGTATVTAACTRDGVRYTANVTVTVAAKLQMLVFDLKNDYIVRGGTTGLSVYLIRDGKAEKIDNRHVTYTTDNEAVARVEGDRLSGVATGRVSLTATADTALGRVSATVALDVLRYCRVRYMAEGGIFATEEVLNTKQAALPESVPLLEGYVFAGWLHDGRPFTADTTVDDDMEVVAGWYKVGGSGEYVRHTVLRDYPDNIGFLHDGSGEQIMEDGSFKVNLQRDGQSEYHITLPAFDFVGQGVTQFCLALNYANLPWTLTLNGAPLSFTSNNDEGHGVCDIAVYAASDGGAVLVCGSVRVTLTAAQANGTEGLTFTVLRPSGSTYAQCVIGPMFLDLYDYRAMLADKAQRLAEMTEASDRDECFAAYVGYYTSLAVATPYERANVSVPDGVTHARQLLSGDYTLFDMTASANGLTATRSDGISAGVSRDLFGAYAGTLVDPGANNGLYTVRMPTIRFDLFTSVRFVCVNMQEQEGIRIGFAEGGDTVQSTKGKAVTLTVTCTDGVWTATLSAEGAAPVTTVLSPEVVRGEKPLTFVFSGMPYQRLYVGCVIAAL